jgi:hypothetical protein
VTCEEARALLLLGEARQAQDHARGCAGCAAVAARVVVLRARLDAYAVAAAAPALERTLAAAAPLLAARRALLREPRRRLVGAMMVVAALLPVIVAFNAQLVRGAYAVLARWLPEYVTWYLVGSLALTLVLLLALACAVVPLLAARQRFRLPEEMNA